MKWLEFVVEGVKRRCTPVETRCTKDSVLTQVGFPKKGVPFSSYTCNTQKGYWNNTDSLTQTMRILS